MAGRLACGLGDNVVRPLFRTKRPSDSVSAANAGSVASSVFQLVVVGLAGAVGIGVFVITGQVAGDIAGPAIVSSLVIAAASSLLSGLCYSEFDSRHLHPSGSVYSSCYQSIGEFPAFVVGWSVILQYLSILAATGRTMSCTFDYISDHKVQVFVLSKFGHLPFGQGSYPDFLAGGILLLPTAMIALGFPQTLCLSYALNAFTVIAAILFISVGAIYVDYGNWSLDGFLPHGSSGLLTGAAICTSAYLSHVYVGSQKKLIRQSRRSLPLALSISVILALLTYFGVATVLTLMVHYRTLNSGVALIQAFEIRDVNWARFMMVSATTVCLGLSLLDCSSSLHSTVTTMAADGLLFRALAKKFRWSKTASLTVLGTGLVASVLAIVFHITDLLMTTACANLVVNTVVCLAVVHQRYQPANPWMYEPMAMDAADDSTPPRKRKRRVSKHVVQNGRVHCNGSVPGTDAASSAASPASASASPSSQGEENDSGERKTTHNNNNYDTVDLVVPSDSEVSESESSSDTDIDAIVEEYKEKLRVATLTHIEGPSSINEPREPTDGSGRRVTFALCGLTLCFVVLSAIVIFGSHAIHPAIVVGVSVMVVCTLILLLIIVRQPQTPKIISSPNTLLFRVPLMPWIPAIAIFLNVCLLLQVLSAVWVQYSIWMSGGVVMYFLYGLRSSNAAVHFRHVISEEQIQLQPLPRQSVVSTLVPSHRKNDDNQRRLTQVDTILISR